MKEKLDIFWQAIIHGPESFLKEKSAAVVNTMYIIAGVLLIAGIVWQLTV